MGRVTKIQEQKIARLYKNKWSAPAVAGKLKLSVSQVYDTLKREGIRRRSSAVQNRIQFENTPLSFNFRKNLNRTQRELLVAAVMLYYGEGAKTGTTVDLANSDPKALKLFLSFLKKVCRVDKKRLRFYLYCFSDQNASNLVSFWSEYLQVDKKNFTKPYVRRVGNKGKRTMDKGVLHIRYSDKRLLQRILELERKLVKKLI